MSFSLFGNVTACNCKMFEHTDSSKKINFQVPVLMVGAIIHREKLMQKSNNFSQIFTILYFISFFSVKLYVNYIKDII